MKRKRIISDSPESLVTPYEDLNTRQGRITGELFPNLPLGVCDECHWCYSCVNTRGIVRTCPMCGTAISLVPLNLDEICTVELDERNGVTLKFSRKLPMR
jgi:hypothetical protein